MWGLNLKASSIFLLGWASSVLSSQTPQVDFKVSYVSTQSGDENSLVFSTALAPSESILHEHLNPSDCADDCSVTAECLGYVNFRDSDCVTLSDLGTSVVTNQTSISYTKFTTYDQRDHSHSIEGYFYYNNQEYAQENTHTVYLDLNHNGKHDQGEPINITVNNNFLFSNIPSGNYLVREVQTDTCTQLWPGVWGDNEITISGTDITYVDSIVQYYHDGHPTEVQIDGGVITSSTTHTVVPNAPTNFILGETPDQYLSFEPGYGIVLAFLDEVITNGEGNDLIITTFGESNTKAHISVSQNNIDYYHIGKLTDEVNSFDIGNFTEHVAYVKLHFFGEDPSDKLNVVTVRGETYNNAYRPPFAYYVSVPNDRRIVFVKDCNFYYHCYTYCIYTRVTFDTMDSCMVGCDLWEATGTCDCANYNETGVEVPFYGEDYHQDQCMDGCEYQIQHNVFPDYKVRMYASGRPSQVTSAVNCDDYDVTGLSPNGCIKDAIESCTRQPTCKAVSLDNHMHYYLYNDDRYVDEDNSYILVKTSDFRNSSLERFTTQTSTATTTQTSTATTTQTSTATTTQTSTATTTQTSTATTTQTTTATTTQTSTVRIEESGALGVKDAFLVTLAVILALIFIAFVVYKYRKGEAKRKQELAKEGKGGVELAPDHQPYLNPAYDNAFSRRSVSPAHGTFISNGNRSPQYLDVSADFSERVSPASPRSIGYMDVERVDSLERVSSV